MLHKVRTSVFIDREILEKAKNLGLNVSQCCENALRLYIQAIESSNSQITKNESSKENSENPEALEMEKSPKEKLVGRAGFEPATLRFLYAW